MNFKSIGINRKQPTNH